MPKKLKVSSNERVDIEDFNRASTGYTEDSDKFHRANLWLSKYHGVLKGFRIELADQSTSPGEFTIYNGFAIDRDGSLLNNEDQIADARTITVTGTNATFYIEVEFTQTESDVDVRAFWDPTYTGNDPAGREFTQNVSTRYSTDWKVVTPVSTTGFDLSTDVDSIKVPVAVLTTNGTNQIVTSTEYYPRTTLVRDAAQTDTILYVADSTLLADSGAATLHSIDGTTTENVTVLSNDRANGIITISGGIALVGGFESGAILEDTSPTAEFFIEESTDPRPASGRDRRARFFGGDEERGTGLSYSKYTPGDKDDLDISSLKDYVDFLSAQIHELKYGRMNGTASPSSFPPDISSSARYYDYAGSIAGARTAFVTIGDGTATRGDFISASSDLGATIQSAHGSLPAAGGRIVVKGGTYTWGATTVAFTKPVHLVFEEGVVLTVPSTNLMNSTQDFVLENFPEPTLSGDVPRVFYDNAVISYKAKDSWLGRVDKVFAYASDHVFENCIMESDDAAPNALVLYGTYEVNNCKIRYNSTTSITPSAGTYAVGNYLVRNTNAGRAVFRNCTFDAAYDTGACYGWVQGTSAVGELVFEDCTFTATNDSSAAFASGFHIDTTTIDSIAFERCSFFANMWANPGTLVGESFTYENWENHLLSFDASTSFNSFRFVDSEVLEVETALTGSDTELTYIGLFLDTGAFAGKLEVRGSEFGFKYVDGTSEGTDQPNLAIRVLGDAFASGSFIATNNTFHNLGKSIDVNGLEDVIVSSNVVKIENTGVSSPLNVGVSFQLSNADSIVLTNNSYTRHTESTASFVLHLFNVSGGAETSNIVISGNSILDIVGAAASSASASEAIYVSLGSSNVDSVLKISDNSIKQEAGDEITGIEVSSAIGTGNNVTISITGNVINQSQRGSLASIDGSETWWGIKLTQANHLGHSTTISGNTIRQNLFSADANFDICGIILDDVNQCAVTGNTITQTNTEATNAGFMYGIISNGGSNLTINDNVVYADATVDPNPVYTSGLYGYSCGIGIEFDKACKIITINGNTVNSQVAYQRCISVSPSASATSDILQLTISNNTVSWTPTGSYSGNHNGGIVLTALNGATGNINKLITISGNVVEAIPGASSDTYSYGIGVLREGTAATAFQFVSITGNSIRFPAGPATAADNGGIYSNSFQQLVISSNVFETSNCPSISIKNGDGCILTGNLIGEVAGSTDGTSDICIISVTDISGSGNGVADAGSSVGGSSIDWKHGLSGLGGETEWEDNNRSNAYGW